MTVVERHVGTPPRTWRLDAQRIYQAHERAYRRAGAYDLAAIRTTFQSSPRETAELFGVTRQAIEQWSDNGVPATRVADVARIADVARRLRRTLKRERIPAIVRCPNPGLDGDTVLHALRAPEGTDRVMAALDRLLSYVPAGDLVGEL